MAEKTHNKVKTRKKKQLNLYKTRTKEASKPKSNRKQIKTDLKTKQETKTNFEPKLILNLIAISKKFSAGPKQLNQERQFAPAFAQRDFSSHPIEKSQDTRSVHVSI